MPGEWYSPTQPFPTKPPAYDRQGVVIDDLIDFTPELRAEAVKLVSRYQLGGVFTPPVVSKAEGPLATLAMATAGGGTNWPGGSYDPETHRFYVFSQKSHLDFGAGASVQSGNVGHELRSRNGDVRSAHDRWFGRGRGRCAG